MVPLDPQLTPAGPKLGGARNTAADRPTALENATAARGQSPQRAGKAGYFATSACCLPSSLEPLSSAMRVDKSFHQASLRLARSSRVRFTLTSCWPTTEIRTVQPRSRGDVPSRRQCMICVVRLPPRAGMHRTFRCTPSHAPHAWEGVPVFVAEKWRRVGKGTCRPTTHPSPCPIGIMCTDRQSSRGMIAHWGGPKYSYKYYIECAV